MRTLTTSSLSTLVFPDRLAAEQELADEIEQLIRERPGAVLGLAAGATPAGLYRELLRRHREGALSFARVHTFLLDEYLDLPEGHPLAFHSCLRRDLLSQLDVGGARVQRLDPHAADLVAEAARYERAIAGAGGIDLQILGIGLNGHLGFNEPGSHPSSRTRVVELHPTTRSAAAEVFGGAERVPQRGLTLGLGTIHEARRLRVLVFGASKAAIVRNTLSAPIQPSLPSTFLRGHPDARLYLDEDAASLIAS